MAEQVAKVLAFQEKIAASRRAKAVERAWNVAKALEGSREQVAGLKWVTPVRDEKKGISRRMDFATEFPEGVGVIMPVPMDIGIYAPSRILVPNEGMDFAWTMPILTRTRPAEDFPAEVTRKLSVSSTTRPTIEVVTFLPFPRADAPVEEQFKPEFSVMLSIDGKQLGASDNYFGAVARFGGKIIDQFFTPLRTYLQVFADPRHQTHFSAEMLVNLSAAELAATPENAGTLDIYIYRLRKAFDIRNLSDKIKGLEALDSYLGSSRGDVLPFDFGATKGGSSMPTRPFSGNLSSIPGGAQRPSFPSPVATLKEVGETRVGEGTKGDRIETNSLEGYGFDPDFAIQRLSIRCLGVREASREATIRALEQLAAT
ncbi:MAG: hypothetical protein Q7S22_00900 [Candidatus Micrarchaeota archaeon]|nr:hypothetical protein [Candidatus Micrarchaeota archaeon]